MQKVETFENKIKEGIAISFFVENSSHVGRSVLRIYEIEAGLSYLEKKAFIEDTAFNKIKFRPYKLDTDLRWVPADTEDIGYNKHLPVIDKKVKNTKIAGQEVAIFKVFGNGINTARDSWVYDFDDGQLIKKGRYFAKIFNRLCAS